MLWVEEAEQQAHGHRLHARGLQVGDQRVDLGLGQRRDDGPVGADALADLEAAAARDQNGRRVLEQVVEIAARRAPQLQHVAEAARGHQRRAGALLLQDGIGDDGGGMRQQAHVCRRNRLTLHGRAQGGQHALGQIARRGQHLGHLDASAGILDQRHVRERPADVDADPPGHAVPFPTSSPGSKPPKSTNTRSPCTPWSVRPTISSYAFPCAMFPFCS